MAVSRLVDFFKRFSREPLPIFEPYVMSPTERKIRLDAQHALDEHREFMRVAKIEMEAALRQRKT